MRQPKHILSANDNAPLRQKPGGFRSKPINQAKPSTSAELLFSDYRRKTTMGWAVPILAVAGSSYAFFDNVRLEMLVWPALVAACLLLWTAAKAEPASRLRSISGLLLIAALTVGVSGILSLNGFSLMVVENVLVLSAFGLIVGWVLKSVPAGTLSTLATLGYLTSLFPQLGLTTGLIDGMSQLGIGLVPFLILFQASLAQRLRSYFMAGAVIVAGYIWLVTLAKDMPLNALAGIGFALASAHYCLGRAWRSRGVFGARLHIITGALSALVSAFYIQTLWMTVDSGQPVPFWPPNTVWWSVLGGAMLALFVSSLMRYKSSQISLVGIFIISLAALALPLATAKPDLVYSTFEFVPGLNAHPGFGLIIGAVLIAFGLIWIVRGLKGGHILEMLIGTAVIGMEAYILYNPASLNMDFGVTFLVALICALCVGGLIAGTTSDQSIRRHQYA